VTFNALTNPLSHKKHDTLLLSKEHSLKRWVVPIRNVRHHPNTPGINPLADAAAIVFTTVSELKYTQTRLSATSVQHRLMKELAMFQQQAQNQKYQDDIILVGRYCLCAAADEAVQNCPWGGEEYWQGHSLVQKLHNNSHNRFFKILQRIQKDPNKFVDLLELMYLCLNLGFKGPYRHSLYGNNQLYNIMDTVYRQIRKVRGEVNNTLSPQLKKNNTPKTAVAPTQKFKSYLLKTSGLTVLIAMMVAGGFHHLYKTTAGQFYQDMVIGSKLESNSSTQ